MLEVAGLDCGSGYVVVLAWKGVDDCWVNEVRVSCCVKFSL